MEKFSRRTLSLLISSLLLTLGTAQAYQLSPKGSAREIKLERINASVFANGQILAYRFGVDQFTNPVHEELTARIWGCETVDCADVEKNDVPFGVLAGVRWNDDPRFPLTKAQAKGTHCTTDQSVRLATQPTCWAELFKRAERGAAAGSKYGPGDPLLYRTHFGDLQFLHAMAASEGEAASETRRKMLDWAEFTWRISTSEFTLETRLKSIAIPTIRERFGMTDWRVLDLLTLGNSSIRPSLRDVSFGTLLHMLQDSFAAGHADREETSGVKICQAGMYQATAPGTIREFHAYNDQDHKAHARADSQQAMLQHLENEEGDVVQVGRTLRRQYQANAPWESVKPYLECVLAIDEHSRPASAGDSFGKA